MKTISQTIPALPIAVGLIVLGWFLYVGIEHFAYRDRQVVVRGLAEKEVMANKVTWPLVIKTLGNDLPQLYEKVNRNNEIVVEFLKSNGISDSEISIGAPQVFDKDAQTYRSEAAYRLSLIHI